MLVAVKQIRYPPNSCDCRCQLTTKMRRAYCAPRHRSSTPFHGGHAFEQVIHVDELLDFIVPRFARSMPRAQAAQCLGAD